MATPTILTEQALGQAEQDQLWDEAIALARIAAAAMRVGKIEEAETALNEQAHLIERLRTAA